MKGSQFEALKYAIVDQSDGKTVLVKEVEDPRKGICEEFNKHMKATQLRAIPVAG